MSEEDFNNLNNVLDKFGSYSVRQLFLLTFLKMDKKPKYIKQQLKIKGSNIRMTKKRLKEGMYADFKPEYFLEIRESFKVLNKLYYDHTQEQKPVIVPEKPIVDTSKEYLENPNYHDYTIGKLQEIWLAQGLDPKGFGISTLRGMSKRRKVRIPVNTPKKKGR